MRKQLKAHRLEAGFTLIELLTVIAIIGVLAGLGLQGFVTYKASAAYSVATVTLRFARNSANLSTSDPDNPPPVVAESSQATQGSIANASAGRYLPGMQLPKNVRLYYGYDPTCVDNTCPYESFLQVRHCQGNSYLNWYRFGDGTEVLQENISGADCPP